MQLCTSTSLHFCPHLADPGTEAGQQRFLGTGAALPRKAVLSAASQTCLSQMSVASGCVWELGHFQNSLWFSPSCFASPLPGFERPHGEVGCARGPLRVSMVRLLVSMGGGLSEFHFLSPQLRTHLPSTGCLVAEAVALTCPWPPVAQSPGLPFLQCFLPAPGTHSPKLMDCSCCSIVPPSMATGFCPEAADLTEPLHGERATEPA